MPSTYLDFEVEVGQSVNQAHPIVVRSLAGQARHSAPFPFTDAELESHLLKLENAILRSAGRRRKNPTPEDVAVQSFGQRLFDFLLTGEALSLYRECHRTAAAQGKGVRLKLNLQPPHLAALPWEFLYDPRPPSDYLCLDSNTPLVRYTELPQTAPPLAVTPPLRILGVVADPTDLPRLEVTEEKARLQEALAALIAHGLIHLTWLDGQTALHLQRTLRRGPWHALHFIGHAGFDTQRDEGLIILANEHGQADPLYAMQLGRLLAAQRATLRLVLLNACEGARGSQQDLFASTAATLISGGIPVVLAMQYEITDGAALQFARTFYESLADNLPVDAAVADARNAIILRDRHSLEWGTPVLHMRAVDGVLFDLAALVGQGDKEQGREGDKGTGRQGEGELPPAVEPAVTPSTTPSPLSATLVANLRAVLATLYSDENSIRRVTYDAGIDDARITFTGRAVDNWHALVREAEKTGKLAALVAVALQDYASNAPLQAAVAALGLTEPQALAPGPAPTLATNPAPPPTRSALPVAFDWVTIPAGKFWMGSDKKKDKNAYDNELPHHELDLPVYRMARTPVTVAQFAIFVQATGYKTTADEQGSAWSYNAKNEWAEIKGANWAHPRGPESDVTQKANHPVTCVSWYDAVAFCQWATSVYVAAGQPLTIRLPSEAEWEKAARGTDGRIWPWGNNAPTDKLCNFNGKVGDTTPVGRYPDGKSFYGCLDMAGNVWEWTSTLFKGYPYKSDDGREDPKASGLRTLRGGSWINYDRLVRCAYRDWTNPDSRYFNAGFRVVSPGS